MLKRLVAILAITAALVACTPSDGGSSPDTESIAPIESMAPASMAPESASPAP